jgi:hypothetical protein
MRPPATAGIRTLLELHVIGDRYHATDCTATRTAPLISARELTKPLSWTTPLNVCGNRFDSLHMRSHYARALRRMKLTTTRSMTAPRNETSKLGRLKLL